jgi:hypothetical protein
MYKIPGFKCCNDAVKSRKIVENKEAPVRDLSAVTMQLNPGKSLRIKKRQSRI